MSFPRKTCQGERAGLSLLAEQQGLPAFHRNVRGESTPVLVPPGLRGSRGLCARPHGQPSWPSPHGQPSPLCPGAHPEAGGKPWKQEAPRTLGDIEQQLVHYLQMILPAFSFQQTSQDSSLVALGGEGGRSCLLVCFLLILL